MQHSFMTLSGMIINSKGRSYVFRNIWWILFIIAVLQNLTRTTHFIQHLSRHKTDECLHFAHWVARPMPVLDYSVFFFFFVTAKWHKNWNIDNVSPSPSLGMGCGPAACLRDIGRKDGCIWKKNKSHLCFSSYVFFFTKFALFSHFPLQLLLFVLFTRHIYNKTWNTVSLKLYWVLNQATWTVGLYMLYN